MPFSAQKMHFFEKNGNLTPRLARTSADVKELFFWKVILHWFLKRKKWALLGKIVQAILTHLNFAQKVPFLEDFKKKFPKVTGTKDILCIRLYWKRIIVQYRGWTVVFQICTMYTAFLDKEIFHQSPGRRSRWHWLHPLKCLCCSWCCAADLVLLCTKLRSCSSRQQSDTTDKYADQNRNLT